MNDHLLGILTDRTAFNLLADRTERIMATPDWDKKLDAGIAPLILAANRIPGVTTVFSCTGHPERWPREKRHANNFYLMLAVRSTEGLQYAQDLYRLVKEFCFGSEHTGLVSPGDLEQVRAKLRFTFTQRGLPMAVNGSSARWYNAIIISGHIPVYLPTAEPETEDGAVREINTRFRDQLFDHWGREAQNFFV